MSDPKVIAAARLAAADAFTDALRKKAREIAPRGILREIFGDREEFDHVDRSKRLHGELRKIHGEDYYKHLAAMVASHNHFGGVALFDVAFVLEQDRAAAHENVKRWINSKQITAKPIGRCPDDSRRKLYRLSEVLGDVSRILGLTTDEQSCLRQALAAKLRRPSRG